MTREPRISAIALCFTVARDPLVLIAGAVLGLLTGAFLIRDLGVSLPMELGLNRATWILVVLSGVACDLARRKGFTKAERRFWLLLELGLVSWFLRESLNQLLPHLSDVAWGGWLYDGLFLLVYLFAILAIEERPHLDRLRNSIEDAQQASRRAAALVFCFGLLVYFVWIPSVVDLEAYQSWVPSLLMYLFLDLALAARFAQQALATRSTPWRFRYGLLSTAFIAWGSVDAMDAVTRASGLTLESGPFIDLSWNAGFLFVVASGRLGSPSRAPFSPDELVRLVKTTASP